MNFISKLKLELKKNPPRLLALGFFIIILTGTVLLSLPVSSSTGTFTNLLDCFFTATSAVCVTGLTTLNTLSHWSRFGHVVILVMIQIGGLGFMSLAIVVALLLKKRISIRDRVIIQEQMNSGKIRGMVRLVQFVLISTFMFEGIGFLFLSVQLVPEYGFAKGLWYSLFHAVSSFCNAGFDLIGNASLSPFAANILVLIPISMLIIVGGIGFSVYSDVLNKRCFTKLSVHSKLAISVSLFLIVFGTFVVFMLEKSNPNTIGNEPFANQMMAAAFQTITTRTAGFATIDQAQMRDATAIFSIILMFIGGSPAGTAGGIKTTTIGLLIFAMISELRGYEDVVIFTRRASKNVIKRAISILLLAIIWVITISFILSFTESANYVDILFEVVSAFGTVGLTRGITPMLSPIGKILIIMCMYMGRLGPLTVVFAINKKKKERKYREPIGDILVG